MSEPIYLERKDVSPLIGVREFFIAPLWGLVQKEMLIWMRSPLQVVISFMAPLVLLAVATLLFTPSHHIKIGVVLPPEPGPYTQQFLQKITAETGVPMFFEIVTTDPQDAQTLFASQRIFAIVTIPPDFDSTLGQGRQAQIDLQVYNGMADVQKNVRLSFNRSLLAFYEEIRPDQVYVSPQVTRLFAYDVSRAASFAAGILVYTLMFVGILSTGVMMTREWEYHTLPELLVSPTSSLVLIVGKIIAGLFQASIITTLVFVVATGVSGLQVHGSFLLMIVVLLLVGLVFCGFGALVGVATKRFYLMMPASGITAVVLWFLCGGFQDPAAVRGTIFYTISRFLPPTYGFDALHRIVNGASLKGLEADLLILAGVALVFVVLATSIIRRQVQG